MTNAPKGNRKKILIIDDNADYRVILRLLLSSCYDVSEASDGLDGFNKSQKIIPDIIICDLFMPVEDGFSFCRNIKTCAETCCIPVILLTSNEQMETMIQGLELGADDYIVKPFVPILLLTRIRNLIENRILLKSHYGEEPDGHYKHINRFIDRAVEYIEEHLSEPEFCVKKLAEILCVSHTSLYRKVKTDLQISPLTLIRNLRLIKASSLLKKGELSVVEVAEAVGYNDLSSFRRHFAEIFGKVPSVYAKE